MYMCIVVHVPLLSGRTLQHRTYVLGTVAEAMARANWLVMEVVRVGLMVVA